MTEKAVEIIGEEPLHEGFFKLKKVLLRHELFKGGWSGVMERELFERDPVVGLLPYDPVSDRVILLEQFRLPAYRNAETESWQTEIVAGIVEPGESLEEVARRESLEEAGCEVKALEKIMTYMPSQGACTEVVTLFAGWVDAEGLGGLHGLDHEQEDILAKVVSFEEAWSLLEEGRLQNSPAIIALQWLHINRARLRELWR
jgi:ADP-ribose pyrophosphatase